MSLDITKTIRAVSYNGSQWTINDGKGWANVKDYGAVGSDGIDDTAAFNAALLTGKPVYVPFDDDEIYTISGTVLMDDRCSGILVGSHERLRGIYANHGDARPQKSTPCIMVSGSGKFQIKCEYAYIEGIQFVGGTGDTQPYKDIAIYAKRDTGYDVDIYIRNCVFHYFQTPIEVHGRGAQIDNCYFVYCNYGMLIDYTSTSSQPSHIFTTDEILGGRGFRITNNRFHLIFNNVLITPAGSTALGLQFIGNHVDNGRGGLKFGGKVYASMITDNIMDFMTADSIRFNANVDGLIIANNTFVNYNERHNDSLGNPLSLPNFGITSADIAITNLTIANNLFYGYRASPIYLATETTPLNKSIMRGNTFKYINKNNSAVYSPIFATKAEDCIFEGNMFDASVTSFDYCISGGPYAVNFQNNIILGNHRTGTGSIVPAWFDLTTNTVQDYS